MKIIGLSGKCEVGKTVLAGEMKKLLSDKGSVVIFNFGDALKIETAKTYKFDVALCYSQEGKKIKIYTPSGCTFEGPWEIFKDRSYVLVRELLQWYGTDYIRANYPDYWVDTTMNKIKSMRGDADYVIVADIRFVNEANAIMSRGKLIRVLPHPEWVPTNDHESEIALDDFSPGNYWLRIAPPFGKLPETAKYIVDMLEEN